MAHLTADYVIVGTGAVGMAFADVLVTDSDASIIMIDRYAKPGGHWNVAYPFVRLHQPSTTYGVTSKELSQGRREIGGLNDGLCDLATGIEVLSYFESVMRDQFLPTGRVQYFPMCEYLGEGQFVSKLGGETHTVSANRKFVDATHLDTKVPSTHKPNFEVEDQVRFMPLNDLPRLSDAPVAYVIIGAGKTGIDACLWLIEHGADPDKMTWIINRDAWVLDRRNTQPDPEFFFDTMGTYADQMEAVASSESIEDMFDRLEACGYFLRLDPSVRPKMFHGATSSKPEMELLRKIKNVVRMGYVQSIGLNEIVLAEGTIPTTPNTVHVDCSASTVRDLTTKPIFQGELITPQMVRSYQPVFSAAVVAYTELNFDDDEEKNQLCQAVIPPNHDTDYISFTLTTLMNQLEWSKRPEMNAWVYANRLDGAQSLMEGLSDHDADKMAVLGRVQAYTPRAAEKLIEYRAQLEQSRGR